jgi:hypothetical protein
LLNGKIMKLSKKLECTSNTSEGVTPVVYIWPYLADFIHWNETGNCKI